MLFWSSACKVVDLNPFQQEAIEYFMKKVDVFVNLPTGYGKSLIYQALPLVLDVTLHSTGHVVVVISPFVNLMKDQGESLQKLGIPAVSLSDIADRWARALKDGWYRVVYGTLEAWLKNEHWSKMLSTDIYTSKLCAITVDEAHIIKQ